MSLVAQHLYVYDGDLAGRGQDRGRARRPTGPRTRPTSPELAKLVAGTPAADEYAAYAKLRDTFVDAQKRAIALSRTETVQNAEERDGSRAVFTDELLEADTAFEQAGDKLIEAASTGRRRVGPRGRGHRVLAAPA